MASEAHWELQARNWAAWTRGPEPDEFVRYWPRFLRLLPPSGGRVLEVGCGEGRVCRALHDAGYDVVGVDVAPSMVELAREADPQGEYAVADATSLPYPDATFGLVVAYNSLMDVDALPRAVAEAARVLRPGGRLCACVTHPTADAGRFEGDDAEAPFVIRDSYLADRRWFAADARRNGVTMEFRGWAYPLESYFRAFEAAGLLVEALREPARNEDPESATNDDRRWSRIPMFLFLRALKPAP